MTQRTLTLSTLALPALSEGPAATVSPRPEPPMPKDEFVLKFVKP